MNKFFLIRDKYIKYKDEIINVIENIDSNGIVIKDFRNTVKNVNIDNLKINVKCFKKPNFFNRIIYTFFRSSKASRSFYFANKLRNMGINSPYPICYYEKLKFGIIQQSFYVSKNINYDFDLDYIFINKKLKDRDNLIKKFTKFTFRLHENGVMFLDHSRSNTIIKKNNNNYKFYLIDLNRMKFKKLSFKQRCRNFRRLKMDDELIEKVSLYYSEMINRDNRLIFDMIKKYSVNFENNRRLRKKVKNIFRF